MSNISIWTLSAAFFLLMICFSILWDKNFRNKGENLKKRLCYYARMKVTDRQEIRACRPKSLSGEEQEILLGILKKVEAKNSSLVRVWTFFAAGLLALLTRIECDPRREYVTCALILSVPFLLASIRGMYQVDQVDTDEIFERNNESDQQEEMQKALMNDLRCKETVFSFSYKGAQLFAIALFAFSVWLLIKPLEFKCSNNAVQAGTQLRMHTISEFVSVQSQYNTATSFTTLLDRV